MLRAEQLHEKVLASMDLTEEIPDEELLERIHQILEEYSREEFIPLREKAALGKELFNAFRRLDILQELLEDDGITEIMINGVDNIFLEKQGRMYESGRRFHSRAKLEDVAQQIVADCNRMVNEASPIVDARLKDGSRVNVVLYPVALNGPVITIRKFPKTRITLEKLLELDALNRETADFLIMLVRAGYNIFISGGTGSGKTTFLNALSDYIPPEERVIVIEDNAELQITELPNLVRLEARNANVEGTGEITIRNLIKTALRMRPTRIIVGEVIASGIDILVHLGRLRDKSRKLLEIEEVLGYEKDGIRLHSLFSYRETGTQGQKITGEWMKCGELVHKEKLLAAGY